MLTLIITTFGIMTLIKTTLGIMTLSTALKNATLSIMVLRVIILSVSYAECRK